MQGALGVTFTLDQLAEFIGYAYRIRNVFQSNSVEEPLELACYIIGAQMTQIGVLNQVSVDKSLIDISGILTHTMKFHGLVRDADPVTKESLENDLKLTEQLMSAKITEVLKRLMPALSEAELELLNLCLSSDTKKPIFDLCTISNSELAKCFKSILLKDSPSFPIAASVFAKNSDDGN